MAFLRFLAWGDKEEATDSPPGMYFCPRALVDLRSEKFTPLYSEEMVRYRLQFKMPNQPEPTQLGILLRKLLGMVYDCLDSPHTVYEQCHTKPNPMASPHKRDDDEDDPVAWYDALKNELINSILPELHTAAVKEVIPDIEELRVRVTVAMDAFLQKHPQLPCGAFVMLSGTGCKAYVF
jgi:hypothetical protein